MSEFMAWKREVGRYFGDFDSSIERFQKPWPADATFELVETSYFGFNIPDANINGEIYHWFHPKLGVASGGIHIFQGMKNSQMHADYMDYRNFQPIPDDLTDCTYTTGIRTRMVKPSREWEISFDNPTENTWLRLNARAIMPPAFRSIGGHLCQAVKNTGTLVLRGKEYKIDSYFTRDRSWGDLRSERRLDIPPPGWHAGVFNDDLAFHVMAFESPELTPAMGKRYPGFEDGRNYLWGYVWKNGELLGLKSCRKMTTRDTDGIFPASVELILTDERDDIYDIAGTISARLPIHIWNSTAVLTMTRWTLDGAIGYGDSQEGIYENWRRENYREHGGGGSKERPF